MPAMRYGSAGETNSRCWPANIGTWPQDLNRTGRPWTMSATVPSVSLVGTRVPVPTIEMVGPVPHSVSSFSPGGGPSGFTPGIWMSVICTVGLAEVNLIMSRSVVIGANRNTPSCPIQPERSSSAPISPTWVAGGRPTSLGKMNFSWERRTGLSPKSNNRYGFLSPGAETQVVAVSPSNAERPSVAGCATYGELDLTTGDPNAVYCSISFWLVSIAVPVIS
jgi:hypothetical protein